MEDVWEAGGARALPYTAGEKINVVSTSLNDDLGNTGAQYILITGLDVNYDLQSEVIIMDGTSSVQSVNDYISIDRARVVLSGSNNSNVGSITCVGATSGSTWAKISPSESITQQSHFTVPNGYTLFTLDTRLSVYRSAGANSSRGAELDQMVYVPETNTTYQTVRIGLTNSGPQNYSPRLVSNTPAKSTVWYRATADTNNSVVTSSVGYLLVKGDYNLRTEI